MVSVAWDYYKNFHMSSKRTHNLHFHRVTPGVHKMTIKTLKFIVRLTIFWILSVSGVLPRTLN